MQPIQQVPAGALTHRHVDHEHARLEHFDLVEGAGDVVCGHHVVVLVLELIAHEVKELG